MLFAIPGIDRAVLQRPPDHWENQAELGPALNTVVPTTKHFELLGHEMEVAPACSVWTVELQRPSASVRTCPFRFTAVHWPAVGQATSSSRSAADPVECVRDEDQLMPLNVAVTLGAPTVPLVPLAPQNRAVGHDRR